MTKILRPGDPRDVYATNWELEYEDVFHFKNLYKEVHDYLDDEGWKDPDGGTNWEFLYFERTKPDGKQEHHIWWRVQKIINDYVRFIIKLDWQTLNTSKKEVMQNGKKFKAYQCNVIFRCEAYVQLDWQNKWQSSPIAKYFDEFYRKRIFKPFIEKYKLELYRDAYKLNDHIKQYLKLKTRAKLAPKTFREEKGIPS